MILLLLRLVALFAAAAGAAGSLGFMLRVGNRAPLFLIALFLGWVLAPFVALVLADGASKRWSAATRVTIHALMLAVTVGSLAIYRGVVVQRPEKPAAMFLLVPLASWAIMAVALPIAAYASGDFPRRRNRRPT